MALHMALDDVKDNFYEFSFELQSNAMLAKQRNVWHKFFDYIGEKEREGKRMPNANFI